VTVNLEPEAAEIARRAVTALGEIMHLAHLWATTEPQACPEPGTPESDAFYAAVGATKLAADAVLAIAAKHGLGVSQ
jgi:hypothetical protein